MTFKLPSDYLKASSGVKIGPVRLIEAFGHGVPRQGYRQRVEPLITGETFSRRAVKAAPEQDRCNSTHWARLLPAVYCCASRASLCHCQQDHQKGMRYIKKQDLTLEIQSSEPLCPAGRHGNGVFHDHFPQRQSGTGSFRPRFRSGDRPRLKRRLQL